VVLRAAALRARARRGDGAVAVESEPRVALPAVPFRGIRPFRYADHPIFFAREEATRLLTSLVAVYRGVFLYGDSGNGKSSLVNAGLFPEARRRGYEPTRVRVQPRRGEELVVEPVAMSDDGTEVLPGVLSTDVRNTPRIVLSIAEFEQRLRSASDAHRTLVVFDQFEEIITLFADAPDSRAELADMIARLLRDPLPVKLVFAFREDYLGRVKQLLGARPELVDQALRLGPVSADALDAIIRGPFERFPGHFAPELDTSLARRLQAALADRFGTGEVSLSEVQTVCLRLWRSSDPAALLAAKGVQGLLEDDLGEALDALQPDLRAAAVALLSQMVTSAGTRNVISAEDLRQRVRADDDTIPPALLDEALERLERDAKLVRRERRRDLYLYEITSEFLVPWISRRRDELRLARVRRRERRRLRLIVAIAAGLLVIVTLLIVIAIVALRQRADARHQREEARREAAAARSLALASLSGDVPRARPDVSLALALDAYTTDPQLDARSALARAFAAARSSGIRRVLTAKATRGNLHRGSQGIYSPTEGLRIRFFTEVPLWDLAFSADGKVLAAAGDDTVQLWMPSSLKRPAAPTIANTSAGGSNADSAKVAISPDGAIVAVAGHGRAVRVWSTRAHRVVAQLRGARGVARAVAFSPDGTTIATAGDDRVVRFWSARTYRELPGLPAPGGKARELAYSPDGDMLATASGDGHVRVLSTATRKQIARLPTRFNTITSLAFSPDTSILAVATVVGTRLWSTHSRRLVDKLGGRFTEANDVAFSHDGKLIATAENESVHLWDAATHRLTRSLVGHRGTVLAVAFAAGDETIASGGQDGTVRLWDPAPRKPLVRRIGPVAAIGFTRGTLLAAPYQGDVRAWSTTSHRPLALSDHDHARLGAALGAGKLVTLEPARAIRVTSIATRRSLARFRTPLRQDVTSTALSSDGRLLAVAGFFDDEVQVIRLATRKLVARISTNNNKVAGLALSPDGKVLAVSNVSGVDLRDVATRRSIATLRDDAYLAVAYSPDGKLLAAAGAAGAIRVWDARTRRLLARLTGHRGPVTALAFSRDSSLLVSGSTDKTVRVWDIAARAPLVRLTGHTSSVNAVAFSPDGAAVASTDLDGTVRLWQDILWRNREQARAAACDVLRGGIGKSDWTRYAPGISYHRTCP